MSKSWRKNGSIHAKADLHGARGEAQQLSPQLAQESERSLPIMHVTGAVLHPQHMSGLGQMRHDRVVARHLAVVGVVAAPGTLDLKTGRDDHPIHIHRHRTQLKRGQQLSDDRRVERLQPLHGLHRELPEPAAHGACGGQHSQAAEPWHQGIVGHVADVLQASPAHYEQPDEQPEHRSNAKVPAEAASLEAPTDHSVEVHPAQISLQQLKPGVGGQLHFAEFHSKISVDTGMQFGVSSSHFRWPFVCGRKFGWHLLSTTTKGHFQSATPFSAEKIVGSRLTSALPRQRRRLGESTVRRITSAGDASSTRA